MQASSDIDIDSSMFIERARCPSCGESGITQLAVPFADPRISEHISRFYQGRVPIERWSDVDYQLDECPTCGLVWQRWILNETTMHKLYTDWISAEQSLAKKAQADASLYSQYAQEMGDVAAVCGSQHRPLSVLDFGMGWGYWCRMAQAFGFDAYGFEISTQRIDHAEQMGIRTLSTLDGLGAGRFDFINCEQVIEHIADPARTLRKLAECCSPRGCIRIAVPDGEGVSDRVLNPAWRAGKDEIQPLEHINCFSHKALRNLAHQAGLTWWHDAPVGTANYGTCLYFTRRRHRAEPGMRSTNLISPTSSPLADSVCCVVRTVGERTSDNCIRLLTLEIGGSDQALIEQVGHRPFVDTLADSLRVGLQADRKWTLCVDADVLALPGAIKALVDYADQMDTSVAEVQGLVFDRLFGGWRPAGVHLYRTACLPLALGLIDEVRKEIRPETALLEKLRESGLQWMQTGLAFGLHDFEQHPSDLSRTCFLHAWKHIDLLPKMLDYWRRRRREADFSAAIAGVAAGIAYEGIVRLDRKTPGLPRQAPLPVMPKFQPADVLQILQDEQARIAGLGYREAPVWDWAEAYWPVAGREAILSPALSKIIESGIRALVTFGDNPVTSAALAEEATRWGLSVRGAGPWWQAPMHCDGLPTAELHTEGKLLLHRADGITCLPARYNPAWPPTDYREPAKRLIARLQKAGISRCAVYGAGEIAETFFALATRAGVGIVVFLVSAPSPAKPTFLGVPVQSPENGLASHHGIDIVIASYAYLRPISARLMAYANIASHRIWFLDA